MSSTPSQPRIEPPEGSGWQVQTRADETIQELGTWVRDCGGYYMRFAPGDGGKLVRLDRVRRWLMCGDDGLPYAEAGESVLKPLDAVGSSDLANWLYMVSEGGYARLVSDDDSFELVLVSTVDYPKTNPDNCGVRGALKHMRGYWCEGSDSGKPWLGQHMVENLAVPLAKAQALWGCGSIPAVAAKVSPFPLADWAALVRYRKANPGSSWEPGHQIEIAKGELKRRTLDGVGKVKALESMAGELGCARQTLQKSLFQERKRPAPKAAASACHVTTVRAGRKVS